MSWEIVTMIKADLYGSLSGFIALFPQFSLSTRMATYRCGGCVLLNCRLHHSHFNLYEWCPLELCTGLISTATAMDLLIAAQWGWCYYSHFKNKKIGAHRNLKKSKLQVRGFTRSFLPASHSLRVLSVARKLPWREANNQFQMVCLIASSSPPPHWEMENPITNKEHGKVLSLRWKDLIIGVNSTNICAVDVGMSQRMLFFLAPRLLGAYWVVFGWEDDSELDGSVCCEACVHQAPKNEGTRGWWLLLVQPVHGPPFNLCLSGLIGTSTEFQAINQVSIFQEKDCQCTQRLFSVPMALNDPPLLFQFALESGPPGSWE